MVTSLALKIEDQVMDIPNKISKRGLIYFPDFCQLVLEKFRGDAVEDEIFRQNMFKVLINDGMRIKTSPVMQNMDFKMTQLSCR